MLVGGNFIPNASKKDEFTTFCTLMAQMLHIGADLVPSSCDTRGKLKLTRGKYLAHPKNFTRVVAIFRIFMSIFRKKQGENLHFRNIWNETRGKYFV